METSLSHRTVWLWILALAALSVGARNFEEGLSLDAPIYATMSRNMERTGEWFRRDCQIPDFVPFAEHTHLGFWMMAAWMKVFPAADWAVRIPGHLIYVSFLGLLFFYIRKRSEEGVAVWTVILLWSMHLFSNVFSTFYLDPGVLLLGTLSLWTFERALWRDKLLWSLLSGALLGLAIAYKGLTFFGFAPVFAWLVGHHFWQTKKLKVILTSVVGFFIATLGTVALYYFAVKQSSYPEFFDTYFARQVTNRFARKWSLAGLFSRDYWWQLFNYTNFLLPLAIIPLFQLKKKPFLVFPLVYAGAFIFMFSTSGLYGGQYLLMILPWLAWLFAESFARCISVGPQKLVKFTAGLSVVLMFLVQYLPIPTHGQGVPEEYREMRRLSEGKQLSTVYLALPPFPSPFVLAAPYAWYGDVRVQYAPSLEETPVAGPKAGYFIRYGNEMLEKKLATRGWCRNLRSENGSFWLSCQPQKEN